MTDERVMGKSEKESIGQIKRKNNYRKSRDESVVRQKVTRTVRESEKLFH